MKIPIAALMEAVDTVSIVPQRPGVTSSEFMKLKLVKDKLTLFLASDVIGVSSATTEPANGEKWEFFVDRAMLVPFLNPSKGTNAVLDLKIVDTQLHVKAGRRLAKFHAPAEVVKGYGVAPDATESPMKFEVADVAYLKLAAKYTNQDALKPELTSISVGSKGIIAAQSTLYFHVKHKMKVTGYVPPMFPELLKGDDFKVSSSGSGMRVSYPTGYVYQLLNDSVSKGFPQEAILRNLLEAQKMEVRFTVFAYRMNDVFTRLRGYVGAVGSGGNNVAITGAIGDKLIRLQVKAPQAHFDETLQLTEPLTTAVDETIHLEWLLPFLEYLALDRANKVLVRWNDASPLVHYTDQSGVITLAHGRFANDPATTKKTKKKAA